MDRVQFLERVAEDFNEEGIRLPAAMKDVLGAIFQARQDGRPLSNCHLALCGGNHELPFKRLVGPLKNILHDVGLTRRPEVKWFGYKRAGKRGVDTVTASAPKLMVAVETANIAAEASERVYAAFRRHLKSTAEDSPLFVFRFDRLADVPKAVKECLRSDFIIDWVGLLEAEVDPGPAADPRPTRPPSPGAAASEATSRAGPKVTRKEPSSSDEERPKKRRKKTATAHVGLENQGNDSKAASAALRASDDGVSAEVSVETVDQKHDENAGSEVESADSESVEAEDSEETSSELGIPSDLADLVADIVVGGTMLGEGAFAAVYEGLLPGSAEKVAVKQMKAPSQLPPDVRDMKRVREMFLSECRSLRGLSHPNVLQLYAVSFSADPSTGSVCLRLATERMEMSLSEWIHPKRVLCIKIESSLEQFAYIAHDAAAGLMYLHSMNVLHRDVKPANVLLSFPGHSLAQRRVKIGDAGFMKDGPEAKSSVGSGWYVAPEISHPPYDNKIDIFSFGRLCLRFLRHDAERPDRHPSTDPRKVKEEFWRKLVDTCTKREASERPTSADLVGELTRLIRDKYDKHFKTL